MTALLWFVFSLLSLMLGLGAVVLFMQGRRREAQDEVYARLQLGMPEEDTGWAAATQIRNPVLRAACHRFWQAGLELSVKQVVMVIAAGLLVAAVLLLWLGVLLGMMVLAILLIGLVLMLQQLASLRQRKIIAQLPEFLEHVLRALVAGNTLEEAFTEATRESVDPLRELFLGVARQIRLGAPIEDTLTQLAEVHNLPDVRVLAMSARVNRRYGGSIRNMIRSLVHVIRGRDTAARELRALTAETRFSALLLFLIPLAITLFILMRNPAFYDDMWADGTGRLLLLVAAGFQFLGGVIIWRMLRSTEAGA